MKTIQTTHLSENYFAYFEKLLIKLASSAQKYSRICCFSRVECVAYIEGALDDKIVAIVRFDSNTKKKPKLPTRRHTLFLLWIFFTHYYE